MITRVSPDLRSARGTGARHFLTFRDDSRPGSIEAARADSVDHRCQLARTSASASGTWLNVRGARPYLAEAHKSPTSPCAGRLTTGSPHMERDLMADGGTVAMMVVSAY
jgi:hypothetical protein